MVNNVILSLNRSNFRATLLLPLSQSAVIQCFELYFCYYCCLCNCSSMLWCYWRTNGTIIVHFWAS